MKQLVLIALIILTCSFKLENKVFLVTGKDVQYLLKDLNKARKNPKSYGEKLSIDLSSYTPRPELKVNDELTLLAQEKAIYLAKIGMLTHSEEDGQLTVYKSMFPGTSESCSMDNISYQDDGTKRHISNLIIDSRTENGHRNQMLGRGNEKDHNIVGIGVAYNDKGETFCCVLTAKK